ncbi:alpha/beta hydrolase [Variovorax sp. J22R24]|uniref:alpha/beta fold hydrolase n=1 Tax=Variovorax gracilis TaxID=3053502 RepID=UPI002574DB51|nr:alpha/beta hydrolase [Variovorax sp. J22R24]MDM0108417.1 alpha/beta hydrolase [Variovorax sp. J22R24]
MANRQAIATQPRLRDVQVLGHGGFRRLAYAEWGSENATRTVLCVHGVSRTGRDFDVLATALAAEGARVIAPDLPGRGRSEWLASPSHYTDRAYTGAMSTLLARLDVDQVDWIGTSLGGHIGMLMASDYATPIRRLVLNDFGARVSASALRRIGADLSKRWRFASVDELEAHLREIHEPFGQLSDAQWQQLAHHSAVPDPAGGVRFHFDPGIARRFAIPIYLDIVLWQLWDKIDCQVLILRGEDSDLLTESTTREMLSRGPAAKAGKVVMARIPDCGHAPALMDDQQIALIKEFLFGSGPVERPKARRMAAGAPSSTPSSASTR